MLNALEFGPKTGCMNDISGIIGTVQEPTTEKCSHVACAMYEGVGRHECLESAELG